MAIPQGRRDEVIETVDSAPKTYAGRPAQREAVAQANYAELMEAKARRFGRVMSQGGMQTDPGLKGPRR